MWTNNNPKKKFKVTQRIQKFTQPADLRGTDSPFLIGVTRPYFEDLGLSGKYVWLNNPFLIDI